MKETNYTPGDLADHEAISAVIKDAEGKVLMFEHKKFGFWTIPIGKAESHETPYQGMCTEVLEECGINVVSATELVVKSYEYERNGKNVVANHHVYVVDKYEGVPKNSEPDKHTHMKFMSIDEIRGLEELSDATLLYLSTLQS